MEKQTTVVVGEPQMCLISQEVYLLYINGIKKALI